MTGKKAPKVEALVVNAIRRLQDAQGSTSKEISNYIAQEYDVPGPEIKKQVQLALKRGVSYGILQRSKGGYYSCNRDFLAKQPMESGDVEIKCRRPRRRASCRKRSRRSRRRRASRCGRRSHRRSRRSRRRRSGCKPRRRRRSGCKPRRRSSRARCGSRRGKRRRRRSSRRRIGRRCSNVGMVEMDAMIPKQPPKRRDDSASRMESHSDGSSVSGSSDNRQMDNQDPQSIVPPIPHMD